MAKVARNVIIQGIQGSIGDLVFRQAPGGETWVSGKPRFKKNRKFSAGQKSHQSRFQEAAAYARDAAKSQPIYAELAHGTMRSPYSFAVADWFNPPVIHEVTRTAGMIRVRASDNIKVAGVRVLILNENGKVVEKKEAAQVNEEWWEVACAAERVTVEVWDLARNIVREEV